MTPSHAFDLTPAPGRYPFPLSPRWTAVVVVPVPGAIAVALFLDGEPTIVIDERLVARRYLRALMSRASAAATAPARSS